MLIERYISNSGLLVGIFFVLFFTFSLLLKYSYKRVGAIFSAFLSEKAFEKKIQEEYFIRNYASVILFGLGVVSISASIYFAVEAQLSVSPVGLFASVMAFIFARLLFISILSRFISFKGSALRPVFYSEVLFVQVMGVIFLFLMLTYLWLLPEYQLLVISILLSAFILFKWIRQLRISFLGRIGLFYIILYFCALELIPILVLVKMVYHI